MVIFTRHIEETQANVTALAPKTVADRQIALREFIAGQVLAYKRIGVSLELSQAIFLEIPIQLSAGEQAGSMIEEDEEADLVQVGFFGAVEVGEPFSSEFEYWHFGEPPAKLGAGETVAQAERPVVGQDLVQR